MFRSPHRTILLLSLFLPAVCLLPGCKKAPPKTLPPLPVIGEKVFSTPFRTTLEEAGEVVPTEEVSFTAEVSGMLKEVNFQEGERVKKGKQLFLIDPVPYEAALLQAKANLLKAKANQENKKLEFNRQKQLMNRDATARKHYDLAKMLLDEANAAVMAAEAVVTEKKVDLSYTRLTAPFDGIMGFRKYSPGNMVGKTSGVLATITKTGDVKVHFSLHENHLLMIRRKYEKGFRSALGKKGNSPLPPLELFFQDGTKYEHKGKIRAWDNRLGSGTGTLLVQGVFPNPQYKLLPGMFVRVRLPISEEKRLPMIPQEAMVRELLGDFVFVVGKGNIVEKRKIKTGDSTLERIQVLKGLDAGELIAVTGISKLRPGMKVEILPAKTSPAGKKKTAAPAGKKSPPEKALKK